MNFGQIYLSFDIQIPPHSDVQNAYRSVAFLDEIRSLGPGPIIM